MRKYRDLWKTSNPSPMALTQDDLAAIEKLISKTSKPIIAKLDDLNIKMEKVLKCVSHENADFDPKKKRNRGTRVPA